MWNEADIGRSEPGKVVDADEPENRVARAKTTKTLCLENNAWRGAESTFLVAYAHVFSKKNRVPKSTFFPRMLAGVGQTPHGNAFSHRAATGDVTLFVL